MRSLFRAGVRGAETGAAFTVAEGFAEARCDGAATAVCAGAAAVVEESVAWVRQLTDLPGGALGPADLGARSSELSLRSRPLGAHRPARRVALILNILFNLLSRPTTGFGSYPREWLTC